MIDSRLTGVHGKCYEFGIEERLRCIPSAAVVV